ncbi:hypothetical protein NS226_07650 [Aureimonas ureilytica]|uniref:Uncharacterized protein n=1 Tax=Aureimonas ureilytica TaxID=401562 RepID=A0A175R9F2_9HYPH|nr:hypothetical protein NS226_07650 [Aureimonas ureilytica]
MAVPAVPGTRFIVVEAESGLGRLAAVHDRPSLALDLARGLDRRAGGTSDGEEDQFSVSELATDQKSAHSKT